MTIQYRADENGKAQQEYIEKDYALAPMQFQSELDRAFDEEEEEQTEEINLPAIWNGQMPEHIRQIYLTGLTEEQQNERMELLSIYEHSTHVPFVEIARKNKVLNVIGAIIWYHPPFKAKADKDNPLAEMHDGYYKILLLTDEFDEENMPIIVEASMGALTIHVLALLRKKGWYLFDTPIRYRFSQNAKTNAFELLNMNRVEAMRAARAIKAKK